jgi:hypothetical protein
MAAHNIATERDESRSREIHDSRLRVAGACIELIDHLAADARTRMIRNRKIGEKAVALVHNDDAVSTIERL